MKIAIVGAGLAGLCSAQALLDAGAVDITVVERRSGPGLETSHANGALLHPSSVEPWNSPGILRFVLSDLGNAASPMLLRPRALPSLLGWGVRFVRESSPARHRANTLANVALALRSLECMKALRARGLEYGHAARGSLATFRDPTAFAAARAWSQWLAEHGGRSRAIGRDEAVAIEPMLAATAGTLAGAMHHLADESGDAHLFCQALAAHLAARGVAFRWSTLVRSVRPSAQGSGSARLALAMATDGDAGPAPSSSSFDIVVLAAAWWSVALAAPAGLRLPVRPAKGYSVTWPLPREGPHPGTPLIDGDQHIAVVPVTGGRLRVAGTAEFCGDDRRIDPARVGNLVRQARSVYPQLAAHLASAPRQDWAALRPMCADGKPLIGATRVPGLFLNTGHGQLGWTTGAASGELLAQLIAGQQTAVDATPFTPSRFRL
ncbi:MAG: FAD-dependent oxidoreductase [Rubrivivax sp.]|nr:FAD-dependent oxidoreductase [Rubrivivax sp.]